MFEALVAWGWGLGPEDLDGAELHEDLVGDLKGFADGVGIIEEIEVKECASNDIQGQSCHLFGKVDGLGWIAAVAPSLKHGVGGFDHHGGEIFDVLAREQGLDHSPLVAPEIAFAGE